MIKLNCYEDNDVGGAHGKKTNTLAKDLAGLCTAARPIRTSQNVPQRLNTPPNMKEHKQNIVKQAAFPRNKMTRLKIQFGSEGDDSQCGAYDISIDITELASRTRRTIGRNPELEKKSLVRLFMTPRKT